MVAAIAIAGASLVSAGVGAYSSMSAADTAASSANRSADLNVAQNERTRGDLANYNDLGKYANNLLASQLYPVYGNPDYSDVNQARDYFGQAARLGSGPDQQKALEATPGYQFALQNGLRATQNSAAAKGLGVSGAAMKGAAAFATGLADSTYTSQFNKLITSGEKSLGVNTAKQGNLTNSYNMVSDIAKRGENAAATTGQVGAELTNQAGNALIASGNDTAAGINGVGRAIGGNANSAVQNYLQYQGIQNGTGSGSGISSNVDAALVRASQQPV
jgi:hypothetical protein